MCENFSRGKRLDNGVWVEGIAFPHDKDKCSILFQHPADGSLAGYEVDPKTVGQYTGMNVENGPLYEGDIVEFFWMRGVVVKEHGAFGIATNEPIDYDLLASEVDESMRYARFCRCDNFVSLWELFWNYEQDDYPLFEVRRLGNVHDNPDLLRGCKR